MNTRANHSQLFGTFPPEVRLVLACIAPDASPAATTQVRVLVAGGLDWELVGRIARWHGVHAHVFNRLSSIDELPIPADSTERMRAEHRGRALRSLALARELARLIRLLDAAAIPALAFKGPVLAIQVYGDVTMRQFMDLDLLIRKRDLPRVVEVLAQDGYRARRFTAGARDHGLFDSSEEEFTKPGGLGVIDVHWLLSSPFFPYAPDAEAALARAITVNLDGTTVATLSPPDLLLFLGVHAAKHGWPALGAATDIAAVIRAYRDLDFDAVHEDAKRIGCRRMLLLSLLLAHDLADAPVPPRLLSAAHSDRAVARLASDAARRMFASCGDRATAYQEWIVPLRAIETVGGRLRYCALRGLTPTAEDREFISLPDALTPLYYLLRPIRLAAQQGSRLFGVARSNA
ncbi:MAG: nucleotidyltransferase domain-containing protein, partial [Candidatus Binataceae bacterium]